MGTREFLRLLHDVLGLPVMAAVDCDPHGIEATKKKEMNKSYQGGEKKKNVEEQADDQ